LLPALVLWLVAVAAPTAAITGTADTIVTSTVAALFYIANFAERIGLDVGASYAHAWSLSIEEQFYFVWPAVLIFGLLRMPPKKRRASLFLGVVGSLLMLVVGQRLIEGNYFLPSGHLVPLAIGALAADLWMFGMPERLDRALKRPIAGFFSIAVIAALVTSVDLATAAEWAMPATGVVAGVLILHVALNERSAPSRLLALAPVEWLGRRSYGLYLYHRTITGLVPALWVDVRLLYAGPLALALSLAVAELSYRFVERPARRRGNAWLDRNHRRNRLRAVAATSD
jgi:peptidoglycan/LPS O-acetylase OafA/YrhL